MARKANKNFNKGQFTSFSGSFGDNKTYTSLVNAFMLCGNFTQAVYDTQEETAAVCALPHAVHRK
jgi:hypothetical protein